jgi:DNA polymerase
MNELEAVQLYYSEIQQCKSCKLHKLSINIEKGKTPGAGYENADTLIIGMASGFFRKKDVFAGTPFNLFNEELYESEGLNVASRVRKTLIEMMELLDIEKEDVYITNILKCSTPKDREPNSDEVMSCFPWLDREVTLLNVKRIICLGQKVSSFFDLQPISSEMQGEVHVIASYHPAYVVYSGNRQFFRALKEEVNKYEL